MEAGQQIVNGNSAASTALAQRTCSPAPGIRDPVARVGFGLRGGPAARNRFLSAPIQTLDDERAGAPHGQLVRSGEG